ncbi:major facilitator superfamily domain-containing protein [Ochromonadaceae sp. CCMP2298]|nr:major facilitator superfamily domain-containing protein [Ochromonadaceae sp. CCMP2298]
MEPISLEEALERLPQGLFQWRLLLMCGMAFMADALEVNLLTFLATCAGDDWGLTNTEKASITGVVFAGIILGTVFWGSFAEKYGRRWTYLLACCIVASFGFLSGAAPNYEVLIVLRTAVGFGLGAMDVPFDLLAEFLPDETRGKFLIYITYFWTLGSLLVTGLAWAFLSQGGWRALTYATAIPVTLISAASLLYLPESPRWLLIKGRGAEAAQVIHDAARVNGVSLAPFTLLGAGGAEDTEGGSGDGNALLDPPKEGTYSQLLSNRAVFVVSLPLWVVWLSFGFTYYGIILFVGRVYEKGDGESCSFDYQNIFLNALSEIVGCTLALFVVDGWGRRPSQTVFYAISGVASLLMGFGLGLLDSAAAVLAFGLVARLTCKTALSATWVTTPEMFPTSLRTVGHASCFALSKAGAFCTPFLVNSSLSGQAVGTVLCAVNLVGAAAASFLPETKGTRMDALDGMAAPNFPSPVSSHTRL